MTSNVFLYFVILYIEDINQTNCQYEGKTEFQKVKPQNSFLPHPSSSQEDIRGYLHHNEGGTKKEEDVGCKNQELNPGEKLMESPG